MSKPLPQLVDVHVSNLRKVGFHTFEEWQNDPRHLYIGRSNRFLNIEGSKWKNPFPVGKRYTLEESLRLYEVHVKKNLINDLKDLEGKVLGCWCCSNSGVPTENPKCHGEILINLMNN